MHKANKTNQKKNLRNKASKDRERERESPKFEVERNSRVRERKLLGF